MGGSLEAVSDVRINRPVIAAVVALAALNIFGLYRDQQARRVEQRNASMVQAASEGMVDLTTIDHKQVDQDVQRILDSSTGTFHDDFAKNTASFADAAKKAQSTSVGTVTEAGVIPDSVSRQEGQVLVAVTVKTANDGAPEEQPRYWRMHLTVVKQGDQTKVSNVEFVS